MYEAICGVPLSPYACRGKRAMSAGELSKIGKWDEASLGRALRHVDPEDHHALHILTKLLHHNVHERFRTLREALEHPFFSGSTDDRILRRREDIDSRNVHNSIRNQIAKDDVAKNGRSLDLENSNNGLPFNPRGVSRKVKGCDGESVVSGKSRASIMSFSDKVFGLRERMRGRHHI